VHGEDLLKAIQKLPKLEYEHISPELANLTANLIMEDTIWQYSILLAKLIGLLKYRIVVYWYFQTGVLPGNPASL